MALFRRSPSPSSIHSPADLPDGPCPLPRVCLRPTLPCRLPCCYIYAPISSSVLRLPASAFEMAAFPVNRSCLFVDPDFHCSQERISVHFRFSFQSRSNSCGLGIAEGRVHQYGWYTKYNYKCPHCLKKLHIKINGHRSGPQFQLQIGMLCSDGTEGLPELNSSQ
ncbi:uncharacterized protein LOC116212381 isoform X2 [Punica granatum]|uniref:Uncharacterized protein LOC116212381 isoform X2 n=1 Tax=Punica granatum TaxID=22663 RepID=A0A6P8E8F8_PUNGR|nr:uncharacterized protein LOC116212381 isoform X2 [Punica granatum]XP_031402825.1 uncharacterized protein LOC116212381 isoform X2 [Punica granatum]